MTITDNSHLQFFDLYDNCFPLWLTCFAVVAKGGQRVRKLPISGLGLEVGQDCAIMDMVSWQPRIHFLILATLQLLTA